MDARIITKAPKDLSIEQVEEFIIPMFEGLLELEIPIYGFGYEPEEGIFVIGPREELEKLRNTNIEDFDFRYYISHTDRTFWAVDLTEGIENLKLNRYKK